VWVLVIRLVLNVDAGVYFHRDAWMLLVVLLDQLDDCYLYGIDQYARLVFIISEYDLARLLDVYFLALFVLNETFLGHEL